MFWSNQCFPMLLKRKLIDVGRQIVLLELPLHTTIPSRIWVCLSSLVPSYIKFISDVKCAKTCVHSGFQTKKLDTLYLQLCPICMYKSKDLAFGCGHQVHKHLVKLDPFLCAVITNIYLFADLLWMWGKFGALPSMPAAHYHQNQALLILSSFIRLWNGNYVDSAAVAVPVRHTLV
jgi:hypothetical protein